MIRSTRTRVKTRAGFEKIDGQIRSALAMNKVWMLLTVAGVLGILARALHWI